MRAIIGLSGQRARVSQIQRLLPVVQQQCPRSFASSNDSALSPASPSRTRRRKRPAFDNLDEVPSFQVFQQKTQVRSLYRQYLRTIAPLDAIQRVELLGQIQCEFRKLPMTTTAAAITLTDASKTHWEVQRALSEGKRRLKELAAMLGTVVKIKSVENKPTISDKSPSLLQQQAKVVPANPWPWQR
jgi:hypothetical protein